MTDVTVIRFITSPLDDYDVAQSVLWATIRGVCSHLMIEENDIMGCVDYFRDQEKGVSGFSLILYDTTPGGAGHVKRLMEPGALEESLRETKKLMSLCGCTDTSCYTCLRSYRNQRDHDILRKDTLWTFSNL